MSDVSNPFGAARAASDAYTRRLLDALGERRPLAVLAEGPDAVGGLTRGLDADLLHRPEGPGKWSIIQVVQHLADSDLVTGYRIRMILAHDKPEIQAYDQDAWAKELGYDERRLADALEDLRALRTANLRLVRTLDLERLQRFGRHSERGDESIEHILRLQAGHDLVHRRQIERVKRAHGVTNAG